MHDRYDANEFDAVEYMATSGGLGAPGSDARITYYGNNGLPHLVFNGGNMVVGAGEDAIDGSVYDPIVQSLLDDATPVKMGISDYNFGMMGGSVTVNIELEDDLGDISQMVVRILVLEDGLNYGGTDYDNILRTLLPDQALTISAAGETQQITVDFSTDPSWLPENMRIVAFVQDDADWTLLQSCNTRPTPDYSLRYYALGERTVIDSGLVTFDDSALFNAGGLEDTYTVSLDTSTLPEGWNGYFEYEGVQYTSTQVTLAPDERAIFNVNLDAATVGEGEVTLIFHSDSGMVDDRSMAYKVITTGTEILLVDDDGAYDYETLYFAPALEATGKSFATWDRNSAGLTAEILENFDMIVWQCGWAFPTVDADDRAALATYLDNGGALFLTGQDIGWEMDDQGGESIQWYHDYLHADFIGDDTNMLNLEGVPGDPIADGLSLSISGGDGADNQEYPSDIDPRDEYASTILTYDASRNGAIKADTGVYKVVYLAFGFEAIDNAADRAALMMGAVEWAIGGSVAIEDDSMPEDAELPRSLTLLGNTPNPFNPMTKIGYSLPAASEVTVSVFDAKGQLVRVVDRGLRAAGTHYVNWNGTDESGRAMSSGVYFCRIENGQKMQTSKMMLVR